MEDKDTNMEKTKKTAQMIMKSAAASHDTSEMAILKCTIHKFCTKMDEIVKALKGIKM